MKTAIRIFTITLLIVTALANTSEAKNPKYKDINSCLFKRKMAKTQTILIDVRTPEEYKTAHLKNAIIIDFKADNFENQIKKLPKDLPICVYCRSGNRSSKSMEILKQEGFLRVYNLKGGINSWQKKGLKTVQ